MISFEGPNLHQLTILHSQVSQQAESDHVVQTVLISSILYAMGKRKLITEDSG